MGDVRGRLFEKRRLRVLHNVADTRYWIEFSRFVPFPGGMLHTICRPELYHSALSARMTYSAGSIGTLTHSTPQRAHACVIAHKLQ